LIFNLEKINIEVIANNVDMNVFADGVLNILNNVKNIIINTMLTILNEREKINGVPIIRWEDNHREQGKIGNGIENIPKNIVKMVVNGTLIIVNNAT